MTKKVNIQKARLIELYFDYRMDTYAIGDLFGVSKTTILNRMKEYGIKPRTKSESRKHPNPERKTQLHKDTLIDLYATRKLSCINIGKRFGCSDATISRRLEEYGIHVRHVSEANKNIDKKITIKKDELNRLYHDERLSARGIANELGMSCTWVMDRLKEHDIETRSISEAISGEYGPSWNGGTGYLPYCHKFNNRFKEKIRDRDDRTCQLCGKHESEELSDDNRRLSVHHIHYDRENCYPDVITLCCRCNLKVNYNRDHWERHFMSLLEERGLLRVRQSELPLPMQELPIITSL